MTDPFKIEIDFDEQALKDVVRDAFEEKAFSGDLSYDCPECGSPIAVTAPSNTCECGFVLNVELDESSL